MIEGLPWPAQLGVAGLGWFVTSLFFYGLVTGNWLVTRREADIYIRRAEVAEEVAAKAVAQNGELVAWAELGKSTFTALRAQAGEDA